MGGGGGGEVRQILEIEREESEKSLKKGVRLYLSTPLSCFEADCINNVLYYQ